MVDYYTRISKAWLLIEPSLKKVVTGELNEFDFAGIVFIVSIKKESACSEKIIINKIHKYAKLYDHVEVEGTIFRRIL